MFRASHSKTWPAFAKPCGGAEEARGLFCSVANGYAKKVGKGAFGVESFRWSAALGVMPEVNEEVAMRNAGTDNSASLHQKLMNASSSAVALAPE